MAADKSLQNLTAAASPTLLLPAQSGLISISQLTDIRWPIPARSVQSEGIAQTSIKQLRAVVKGVDDTGSLGAVEIMMWPKAEQKNQKPAHILAEVQRKLQNSGYLYSETVKQGDAKNRTSVREFVAVNTRKKQVVCGFWMLTDQFVLLSWGEMTTPKALP